jgi:hypothetical protein
LLIALLSFNERARVRLTDDAKGTLAQLRREYVAAR